MSAQEQKARGKFPAQGKLLANLTEVTKEDRARAGITDEMANAMVASNKPKAKGVEVTSGPFQPHAKADVEEQVRVIDHDRGEVLFSGSPEQFARLNRALVVGGK